MNAEPLLEMFDAVATTADERPAQDNDSASSREWLDRIIELAGGRDMTMLAPSVDALLGGEAAPAAPQRIAVDRLFVGGFQTRRTLDEEATARLAESIAERGVLEPLLVRQSGERFQIIAGTRRFAAAQRVGLAEIPVVVLNLNDREAMMVALVENLQREDIAPLDEAACYYRLLDEFQWTQDELARQVGRSRSHISNTLRLLALPEAVKSRVEAGMLTAGHARAVLGAADPEALAAQVEAEGLSVRATEALAQRRPAARRSAAPAHEESAELAGMLAERLGLSLRLRSTREGGKLTITYSSITELDSALRAYGSSPPLPSAAVPSAPESP
jgi:ParB family chromosome partitioning protein